MPSKTAIQAFLGRGIEKVRKVLETFDKGIALQLHFQGLLRKLLRNPTRPVGDPTFKSLFGYPMRFRKISDALVYFFIPIATHFLMLFRRGENQFVFNFLELQVCAFAVIFFYPRYPDLLHTSWIYRFSPLSLLYDSHYGFTSPMETDRNDVFPHY